MRLRRRPPVRMTAQEALRHEYGQGFADGVETTVRLALGQDQAGGIPYRGGGLPSGLVLWLENALANVEEEKNGGPSA